jgi:choline dehydrogenase-like flavoprotein
MIADFNTFDPSALIETDVCIIGAGAAGIAIAREFLGSSRHVLLLESGGLGPEADSQHLYDSKVIGLPHQGIHEGRARTFGGTTTLWGGQALRFDDDDFEARPWVPYSGWPITRKELDPYYDRAEGVMRLDAYRTYTSLCVDADVEPPRFDDSQLYMECSQWSPRPNFAKSYSRELQHASNITVLLHANVTAVVTEATGSLVKGIEFQTLQGKKGRAKARFYVLCAGAIETARLLLVSDRAHNTGIGNAHGLVGRFFQEHLHWDFGLFFPSNRPRLQDLFESFFKRGFKYAPKVTLARTRQKSEGLL